MGLLGGGGGEGGKEQCALGRGLGPSSFQEYFSVPLTPSTFIHCHLLGKKNLPMPIF